MTYQIRNPEAKISPGQLDYLCDLIDGKDLLASPKFFDAVNAMDAEEYAQHLNWLKQSAATLNMGDASRWIDALRELPYKGQQRRQNPETSPDAPTRVIGEPEAGMYKTPDGTIFRVYLGQQSGRMLVKRVVRDEDGAHDYRYEYVGAAAARLPRDAEQLSLDEAKAWGRMTGHCCVCARRLDVPESVEAGIGPVCAGRMEV